MELKPGTRCECGHEDCAHSEADMYQPTDCAKVAVRIVPMPPKAGYAANLVPMCKACAKANESRLWGAHEKKGA